MNYKKLDVKKLEQVAPQSLITITLKIAEKQYQKKNPEGKNIDVYLAQDGSGCIKLTVFDGIAGNLMIGGVYTFTNIRVNKDKYGQFSLVTPKDGSGFKACASKLKIDCQSHATSLIKGEFMSISVISRYRECDNCHKKLTKGADGIMATCSNEKCNNSVKYKFATKGMYLKCVFMTEENKKLPLTLFYNEICLLVPTAWDKNDEELKLALLSLENLVVSTNKNNIVTHIQLSDTE